MRTNTTLSAEFLKHYNILHEIGLWEELEDMHRDIHDLEELTSTAIEIFNKHSIEKLIDYVISFLLDKYVPSYLLFAMKEPLSGEVRTMCYENLKETHTEYHLENFEVYEELFEKYPNPISFTLFEYQIDKKELTDKLLEFRPEFIVPMSGIGGILGIVLVGQKIIDRGYSQHEISYIHRTLKFASTGIQNNLHHQSSIIDCKTKLFNHYYLMKRLEEERIRVERHGSETEQNNLL